MEPEISPEAGPAGAGQDPSGEMPMAQDPSGMGQDTGIPEDPSMMPGTENDPMDSNPAEMPEESDDSDKKDIQKATGELSQLLNDYQKPDEELDKYVKGMIDSALDNRKEASDSNDESLAETPEGLGMEPKMESVTFTKGQMKKIQESLNPVDDESAEKDDLRPLRKKGTNKNPNSPFNAPTFK